MKLSPYSNSKLVQYKQCPRKFKYFYIDKVGLDTTSIHLTKGNIVHKFIELHEKPLAEKIEALKKEKQIASSPFFTKELVKECVEIYNKFVDTAIFKRLNGYMPLGTEMRCALSKKLEPADFFDKESLFRGVVDKILVDVSSDTVYIVDWKTGSDKSSGMYKQEPDQLMYYGAWYFSKFPVDKIKIMYVFVEHENAYLEYELQRENVNKYSKALVNNIVEIERDETFERKLSPLCSSCPFIDDCNPYDINN